ncbi:hypothetical protein NQ315_016495 [Exocentrus adspersus]|uniref:Uncharacterized protein n=1 Tax=Exocentrus adspersus TaxID=1586481 RepID=A0AAV8VZS8_9CUCU|nr:hypothetical protein NQ315_016495 [Exocentrus adspersus]
MTSLRPNKTFLLTLLLFCLILSILFLSNSPAKTKLLEASSEASNVTETYPGSFVHYVHPKPSNTSYCKFNYKLPFDLSIDANNVDFGPEQGKDSLYRILYNVIEATIGAGVPGVTYATHITADFVNYIPELIRYWDGLISVAAFVPDTDVALVLEQINQYCYCLPGMSRVSVHLVYHKKLPPSRKDVYFTRPDNCVLDDSSKLETHRPSRNFDESVIYPINVCRNVARTASMTDNVLVSDIQLMPSEHLAKRFWDMMIDFKYADCPNKVFVVPIFEVASTQEVPRTKKQLVQLVKEKKAVYFHRLVCSHCQKFPGVDAWMETDPGESVKPFLVTKREMPFHRWEPIYIGTKNEPLYNEKLSWEGLQDKMLQMLEMCLLGYKFVILDGAFLVHWPGIKKTKTKDETWRNGFVKGNSAEYQKILKKLSKKYKSNPQCKLQ